jgi:hypothetical protein
VESPAERPTNVDPIDGASGRGGDLVIVEIAADAAELLFQEGIAAGPGNSAHSNDRISEIRLASSSGMVWFSAFPTAVSSSSRKSRSKKSRRAESRLRPRQPRMARSPSSYRTRFVSVTNRSLASNLTVLGSFNIEIGLLPPSPAGADWFPPSQFDFDVNAQRGMADRKAWARVFSDLLVPHHTF